MQNPEIVQLLKSLISARSVTGMEASTVAVLADYFARKNWKTTRMHVADGRENLLVEAGTPEIIFSTHTDVVPAPESLFTPRIEDGKLFGRGTVDAKSMIAAMVFAFEALLAKGVTNIGMLFVVGEEDDGIGAKVAAKDLGNRGIKWIINGEPTERKIMIAHRGLLGITINVRGRACHSGFPHLGIDANRILVNIAHQLQNMDFPGTVELGKPQVNVGLIQGGVADNVIAPAASLKCLFRTGGAHEEILETISGFLPPEAVMDVYYNTPPLRLTSVPGFETDIAAFGSDLSNLTPLNANMILYGPGTMTVGHTDHEHIEIDELIRSVDDYVRLVEFAKSA